MEETKGGKHAKKGLTPAATVLLTIAGALLAIIVIRVIYFIITGN